MSVQLCLFPKYKVFLMFQKKVCVCTCVFMHAKVSAEASRGSWIPWSWNYKWLQATRRGCLELGLDPLLEATCS